MINASQNDEPCVFEDVGRWSDVLRYASASYLALSALLVIVTSFTWIRFYKKLVYLEKRGFVLIFFVTICLVLSLITGPLGRTSNVRESFIHTCSIVNLSFLLVAPSVTIACFGGVFLFTRRVKLGKTLAKASETRRVSLSELNQAWFFSTNNFAIILFGSIFLFITSVCLGFISQSCPELGSEDCNIVQVSNPLIVAGVFSSMTSLFVLVFYISRILKTYPDPFDIVRSVRNGLGIALLVEIPGIVLSSLDVGEPDSEEREDIYFSYGVLYDIPILVIYLYFGPYQLYRAFKFNALDEIYVGTNLDKVLRDPTGRKLFKEHLINEFNYENLVFIDDVEEFRKLESVKERNFKAIAIFQTHFEFTRLNLSHTTGIEVERKLKNDEIDENMFDEAFDEIWGLLESDPFHRFQKSAAFNIYVGTQSDASKFVSVSQET